MQKHEHSYGILSLATAVPPYRLTQAEYEKNMAAGLAADPALVEWLLPISQKSGVETRYFAVPDFLGIDSRWAIQRPAPEAPSTAERMDIFRVEAPRLGAEAARAAIAREAARTGRTPDAVLESITHIITVSGTGAASPGLDAWLVEALGLSWNVGRVNMGCFAGMTALRQAGQIVAGDRGARVLIVVVELDSMHVQHQMDKDTVFPSLIFGDGAAACIVGEVAADQGDVFVMGRCRTALVPKTTGEITILMGNNGQRFRLSARVPARLAKAVPPEVASLMDGQPIRGFCAMHPGGKAIIDALVDRLELTEAQVSASRNTMRDYGNTAAAAILFVLAEVQRQLRSALPAGDRQEGVALGFGPGLTVELARLTYVAPVAAPAACEELVLQGV